MPIGDSLARKKHMVIKANNLGILEEIYRYKKKHLCSFETAFRIIWDKEIKGEG